MKKERGRPEYEPTPYERKIVMRMVGYGVPESDIVQLIDPNPQTGAPISLNTFRKHYGKELATGVAHANAQVAGSLKKSAMKGNVVAQIFWLKTRARWKTADDAPQLTINNNMQMAPHEANYQSVEENIAHHNRIKQLAQKFLDDYLEGDYTKIESIDEK